MEPGRVLLAIWGMAAMSALSVLLAPSPKIAPLGPLAVAIGLTIAFWLRAL